MSTPFYDLASLVVVPSGYKASKVYAQKPLTTDGQLAFSRASTATRVNASGLIETVASNVPRLDYLGSTCPKLQLEPQRSNVYQNSEDLTTANWTKTSCTISANAGAAPDGTTTADKLVMNNGLSPTSAGADGIYQVSSVTSGVYTVSFFAKAAEFSSVNVRDNAITGAFLNINLTTGAVTNPAPSQFVGAKTVNYGNGWYRVSFTTDTVVATQAFSIRAGVTGDGTGGFLLWGLQFELGTYETSYIKTASAAVTRLDESTIKTGISSLIGQQEGVIYWEGLIPQEGTGGPSNSSNMLNSARNINSNSGFSLQHIKINNSVNALFFVGDGTFNPKISLTAGSLPSGTYAKIAFAYKSGSSALYVNGVLAASSSTTFTSSTTISEININDLYVYFGYPASQSLGQMLIFKTRLTNAQLAELTTL